MLNMAEIITNILNKEPQISSTHNNITGEKYISSGNRCKLPETVMVNGRFVVRNAGKKTS